MNFDSLKISEPLVKATRSLGFVKATLIQEKAIPAALAGRDVLGTAQTGTGKTVAFLLPGIEHLLQNQATKEPRMVVIAPTRELAVQIAVEGKKLAQHTNVRIATIYGGVSIKKQADTLRSGVDMLVATPGRLLDHLRRGNVKFRNVKLLVLDEADRMLDMGFMPDIKRIMEQIPTQRQTMLFSATMPQAIVGLTHRFLHDPVRVEVNTAQPPKAIEQILYPVPKHLKSDLLAELLSREVVESALVFTRTKQEADILTRKLRDVGMQVGEIHGDFSQKMRTRALDRFRQGKIRILIATNVAARGLDIEGLTHVINYDAPEEAENYVHRIGRTGRVEASGVAWTLVTPEDEPLIHSIEYLLGHTIERQTLDGFDYDVAMPDWAKPSAEIILKRIERQQSKIDRWKSLTR